MQPIFIGVCGGSSSGKTTLAKKLQKLWGSEASILSQDNYYIDQSANFDGDGGRVNFDHPDAIDFNLLTEHLAQLKRGQNIEVPLYDFKTHQRFPHTLAFRATPIILVEGILILYHKRVREFFSTSVFIDVDENIRFQRRLMRDTIERGRDATGVTKQFYGQVKPMHDLFVQTSLKYSKHLVINNLFEKEMIDNLRRETKNLMIARESLSNDFFASSSLDLVQEV
jgi:uridine kinase